MNEVIKNYFKNFGLPKEVLETINSQVMDSLEEDFTDDDIKNACKGFDNLAKSFQSTVDARVNSALAKRKKPEPETPEPTGGDGGGSDDDDKISRLEKMIQGMATSIESLKNEKINESLTKQATNRLKEIKMTDSEIRGVLHGRQFKSIEEVEDFVDVQSEIHEETLKTRQQEQLGDGNAPKKSFSHSDNEDFRKEVREFLKQN